MINLTIKDNNGNLIPIEVPEGISLSLMEVLKATGFDIEATCGGMALCASCHVQVLKGPEKYFKATDAELDLLDTLPDAAYNSRLACQLRISEDMDGMVFRVMGEGN